jgi:hypothetical protein
MAKNFVVTARVDIRDVATLVGFLSQKGLPIRGKSLPVVVGFEIAAEIIRDNHPSLKFGLETAVELVRSCGIDTLNNRGSRTLMKDLQHESLDRYLDNSPKPDLPIPESIVSTEEEKEREKRRKEELEENIRQFKNISGLLASDE